MTAYADAIAKPPRTLTELEQKLILKTTGEHRDGFRDHVLISLALGTTGAHRRPEGEESGMPAAPLRFVVPNAGQRRFASDTDRT